MNMSRSCVQCTATSESIVHGEVKYPCRHSVSLKVCPRARRVSPRSVGNEGKHISNHRAQNTLFWHPGGPDQFVERGWGNKPGPDLIFLGARMDHVIGSCRRDKDC